MNFLFRNKEGGRLIFSGLSGLSGLSGTPWWVWLRTFWNSIFVCHFFSSLGVPEKFWKKSVCFFFYFFFFLLFSWNRILYCVRNFFLNFFVGVDFLEFLAFSGSAPLIISANHLGSSGIIWNSSGIIWNHLEFRMKRAFRPLAMRACSVAWQAFCWVLAADQPPKFLCVS